MELENKRLYHWLPWVVALAVTVLFIVLLRNELASRERGWQEHLVFEQQVAQVQAQQLQQAQLRQARALAQLIAQNEELVSLVRQAYQVHEREGGGGGSEQSAILREKLFRLLQASWARLAAQGVRELNVHVGPGATAFLRMHKMDRFGDDESQLSPLLESVLRSGVSASGMELGHYGARSRAFVPLFANDKQGFPVIGALEIALPIVETMPNDSGDGQAIFLRAAIVNDVLWGASRQDVQNNSGNIRALWSLESFTQPIIRDWYKRGALPDWMAIRSEPWLLHDGQHHFLFTVTPLAPAMPARTPAVLPNVLYVNWTDVSHEFNNYQRGRQSLMFRYIGYWVVAEILLLILFRYNRAHIIGLLRDYSQHLKAERDQSEHARHRLNLALTSSESGFWEWNITTNQAMFSKEWRELCGLPANADGKTDVEDWMQRVHPSDKRASYNEMIRHIKGETPMFENEYRLKVADGSYKWIFTRGKVVEWQPDGKAVLMLGVYTDITQRKKNEIIVIRQQAALRVLNEIASAPALDAEAQLRRALMLGSRYLGLPVATVSRVQGNQYQLKMKIGPSDVGPVPNIADALSNHLCEHTLLNADVLAVDDIEHSEFANHPARLSGHLDSYIGVPIWLKGLAYGTLAFASDRSRHQTYDELDKDFMRLLARWVGVTLERWQHQSEQQSLIDRFDKLCNQLPGFLFQYQLRPDGTSVCPYASAGIYELFGVTPDDVHESAEKLFECIHPEDVGWIGQLISQSASTLKPWLATFRVLNRQRGERWVHGESRPEKLPDGSVLWHGFVIDISEEKRAEIILQDVNSLREAIFDAASIAIISTDTNGVIKTFNHGAERLLGYSAKEMIDIASPTLFHLEQEVAERAEKLSREFDENILPGFEVFTVHAREGDEDEYEWTYVRKDGSQVPVILSVTALRNPDGEITGYLGLARDISEIKRIDRLKSEFISTVSHELRTPLTAISGALGIIVNGAAGQLPDTAIKMLNIAHKNSLRLIHLVNDLLDMEKLVAGKMYFDFSSQKLLPLVLQSLEANATYAAQYNVNFVLKNLASDDVRVHVDPQRLQQVLANFLSNAAKFSPPDSQVNIVIEDLFGGVRVSVTDKGPGIPTEFRDRIFQKFSQADSSDSRQKGGTGLGLAICKEIIGRLGGKIGYRSEPGNGAEFYFEIPREDYVGGHFDKAEQRTQTGNRVLVVEADPEVADLWAALLRNHNYRVDVTNSAQGAGERFALYGYQAAIVDLDLEHNQGFELVKQLHSDSMTQRMPVIAIYSGYNHQISVHREDPAFIGVHWVQKSMHENLLLSELQHMLTPEMRSA